MKALKPSFENIPLERGTGKQLFGRSPKPDSSHGSAMPAGDVNLSQAGETWVSNTTYGEGLGKDSPPDLGERYVVQGEIAHGGMGVVFRALDRELGRHVAIKILREKYQDRPDLVKRFIEEAQVAGQLQHPGVAPVYEIGHLPGNLPYFTMKLIEGCTLDALLLERKKKDAAAPCPMGQLLKIFEQVAQTVAYAHSRNIIHRDLKPHNVMVGAFGEVQVMDWGLAKLLGVTLGVRTPTMLGTIAGSIGPVRSSPVLGAMGGSTVATQVGAIVGTPAYMAPEQARGEITKIDRHCDVFGLGAILCEILTGKPPFPGVTGMESCDKACRADMAEVYKRLEECDADAGWIVLARECLSADPDFRPPDAGHVAARVSTYMADLEARARKAEREQAKTEVYAQEQAKRRRLWRTWAVAMILALVIILLMGIFLGAHIQ